MKRHRIHKQVVVEHQVVVGEWLLKVADSFVGDKVVVAGILDRCQ